METKHTLGFATSSRFKAIKICTKYRKTDKYLPFAFTTWYTNNA